MVVGASQSPLYPQVSGQCGSTSPYSGVNLGAHTPAMFPWGYGQGGYGQGGCGMPFTPYGVTQGAFATALPYPPMAYPTAAPVASYPVMNYPVPSYPPLGPVGSCGVPLPPMPPVPGMFGSIVQSVSEMIRRVGMLIRDAGKILGALIDIWTGSPEKAQQALMMLAATYGGWIARFAEWLYGIRQRLAAWVTMTAQEIARFIDTVTRWLQMLPGRIQNWLNWLSTTLSMQITPAITEAVTVVTQFLNSLIASLRELGTAVAATAQRIMGNLGQWLAEFPQLLAATWAQLQPQLASCWSAIVTILREFWQQLVDWLGRLPEVITGVTAQS